MAGSPVTRPACCTHCGPDCRRYAAPAVHSTAGGYVVWPHGMCPVCAYAAAVEDLYRRRVVGSIYGPTAAATAEGVGLALDILTNHPGDDR